jgi:hypothetical protein
MGAVKETLPEGAQRSLPLNGIPATANGTATAGDRVLAGTPD